MDADKQIADRLSYLPTPENQVQLRERIKDIDTRLAHAVRVPVQLAWYKHLQYDFPAMDMLTILSYAAPAAIEFFFGDYRESYQKYPNDPPYNRETSQVYLWWVDVFCESILCSLFVKDRDGILKISSYLDDDLIASCECHKSDMWFYILLGKYLRGESLEKNRYISKIIRGQSRKRAKLLLDILESIDVRSEEFGKNITCYIKYFVKHEVKSYSMNEQEISLQLGCVHTILSSIRRHRRNE